MNSLPIKIAFVDFAGNFISEECHLFKRLLPHFNIELSSEPDYLFFSIFGSTHLDPKFDKCVRILCLAENLRPDYTICDYSLSFDHSKDPRNLRLPYYVETCFYTQQSQGKSLIKPIDYDPRSIWSSKTRFCDFIYTSPYPQQRVELFHKLSKYKQVDSGGKFKNNLGFQVDKKLDFQSTCKFTIAFENSSHPGYVTEKLTDAMLANSIPIYWGNPLVSEEFNSRSFINCHEYPDLQSVIQRIIEIDQDNSLYLSILNEPWLHGNELNTYCQPNYLIPFFQQIFTDHRPRSHRPVVKVHSPGWDPKWNVMI
jgi:hypothetical protein